MLPSVRLDKDYLTPVVAVLGTTISPYLFFWQASQEAEDIRAVPTRQILKRAPEQGRGALNRIHLDTLIGMGISNFIALAILITAAATLHANGVTDSRPRPGGRGAAAVAGRFAETIFALGVIGTGLLSVPCWQAPRPTPSAKPGNGRPGSGVDRWKRRHSMPSSA